MRFVKLPFIKDISFYPHDVGSCVKVLYTSLFAKMVASKKYIQKYTIKKNGSRNKEK